MLALALTVFRLLTIDPGPWRPDGAGVVVMFDAPRGIAGKHVRLKIGRPARLRLNGTDLGPAAREFDLPDLLIRGNRLSCDADPGTTRLLVTPRVFASEVQRSARGITVTIRNTLENTANVSVTVRARGEANGPSAAATVGPGTAHAVELPGEFPEGPVEVLVQKEEEAVEGRYQFLADFDMIFRTGTRR